MPSASDHDNAASANVVVLPGDGSPTTLVRAAEIAERCRLPLADSDTADADILLAVTAERIELRFPQRGGPKPLCVDFVEGPQGYARRVNRFGLLYTAIGFSSGRPTVLDATAGLGRDAFRLAYHGCHVTAIERSAILFALLEDGVARAMREPDIAEQLDGRLRVWPGDARAYLRSLPPADAPDVVYLDPMFPPKKKSALVKIEMPSLRHLVGNDPDAADLFEVARATARRRVVVKRHRHAPPLAPDPTHAHADKTTRYDVYMVGVRGSASGG